MSDWNPEIVFMLLDVGLMAVAVQILFLLSLRNAIACCAPHNRTVSPGQVWLLLIPLFNLVWQFLLTARIAESLRREFTDRRIEPLSPQETFGKNLGLTASILSAVSVIPFLGLITGVAAAICWILYWAKIARFAGILETTSPVAGSFETSQPEAPLSRNLAVGWLVLVVLVLGVGAGGLPAILRSLSMISLRNDLRLSGNDLSALLLVYSLAVVAGALILSIVAAVGGARRAFLISLAGTALFGAAAGLISDAPQLAIVTLATGLFAGGVLPASVLAIREWMPPNARPFAIGLVIAARLLPSLLASSIMGALTMQFPWRIMLFIGSIPAVIVMVACVFVWPGTAMRPVRQKWAGSAGAIWMLAIGLLLAAPVLLILGSGVERYAQVMFSGNINRIGTISTVNAVAGFFGALLAGVIAFAIQSGGVKPSRIRAVILTLCGLVLPLVAVLTHVAEWPLFLLLTALCSAAYYGWSTMLHTAVADTASLAAVSVTVALGMAAGNLGLSTASRLLDAQGLSTLTGVTAATTGLALIVVALIAWLATTEPAA